MNNLYSKQAGAVFLVFSATFVICKMYIQNKWGLHFSLFSDYFNMKIVFSKQVGGSFLVY